MSNAQGTGKENSLTEFSMRLNSLSTKRKKNETLVIVSLKIN
jgi:hypothetical protein